MSSTPEEKPEPKRVKFLFCIPLPLPLPLPSPFNRKKRQTQELIPLDKHDGADQTLADATKASEQELTEAKVELAKIKAERDETKGKYEDEIRDTKERLEAQEKEGGKKDADIQRLETEANAMRSKLAELQAADARARELTTLLAEREKLLDERTTELNAAQVFLTKVDAVSEAEVVGMVDNLNTLICSVSGALSDTWDQREPIPGTLVEESHLEQIRNAFGNLIIERIAARDPVAVNLAVQMCLSWFIERITSGWGSGAAAGNLSEIYGMIATKESQTVASRWRTLTKRYTPHQKSPQTEEIICDLARILVHTQSFSDLPDAIEAVGESAGVEIKKIIDETIKLDDTIKTKIASSDMSVYIVPRGKAFTEETMVDECNEGGSGEGGESATVAGTMEIGLFQKSGDMEKVLRKPKVILERDLVAPEGGDEQ